MVPERVQPQRDHTAWPPHTALDHGQGGGCGRREAGEVSRGQRKRANGRGRGGRGECSQAWGQGLGLLRGTRDEAESQRRALGAPRRCCLAGLVPKSGQVSPGLPPKSYTLAQVGHVTSSSDAEPGGEDSLPEGAGLGTEAQTVCPLEGLRCSAGKQEGFISPLPQGEGEAFADVRPLTCILHKLYLLILAQTWQVLV